VAVPAAAFSLRLPVVLPAVAAAPEHVAAPTVELAAGAVACPAAAFSLRLPVVLPAVAAAPEYVAVPTVELAAGAVPVPAAAFEPHPPVVWRAGRGHAPAVAESAVVRRLAEPAAVAALANVDARERYLRRSAALGGAPAAVL